MLSAVRLPREGAGDRYAGAGTHNTALLTSIVFQGTAASTFSDLGVLTADACKKACSDNPNCAAAVLLADGNCHMNVNGL